MTAYRGGFDSPHTRSGHRGAASTIYEAPHRRDVVGSPAILAATDSFEDPCGLVLACPDGRTGRVFRREHGRHGPTAAAGTDQGQAIVAAAAAQQGTPYCLDGGNKAGPTHGSGGSGCGGSTAGFDCSGLALYAVYQATGVVLPHNAAAQTAAGGQVISSEADLQPGDLVFFGGGSLSNAQHVGIYAGGGEMWDANDYNVPVQEHALAWEEAGLSFDGGVRYWAPSGTAALP